jgi:sporulation protein YtfJ
MSENKLNDIIQTSLDSIRSMVDSNTVIGSPITTANGTLVIPVSKVFVGFASGGIDYRDKNAGEKAAANNFGGGGGTGLTVSPVGFLVVSPNGSVELLNVNEPTKEKQDPISQIVGLLERSPDLIERFQAIFSKKPEESSTAAVSNEN